MLKNLKRAAAIVLSFAMAIQFGLANSYYVNAEEEPVEPQQEQTTTVENNSEVQEEGANEVVMPETKSVELSYVAEDGTVLQAATYRDFDLNYGLNTDSSVMLNFDGYTLKDVIVNNSQAVSADQASLSVTSDLVSVQFVYKKIVIETENQTTEPCKTEEKNEDDAEADPEVKEELPEYPAFDQSEMAGDVVVHATAAEGVLPRDSKLVVKRITRKAILNAVEDTVSEKNKEMDSAVALDITIQNKDGVEIQPNGSVNISFENAAVSGDEINVYHVTDDASAVTEVATNTQSFDANHFSIYVITGEKEKPLTTFNFVANGNIVSKQIVKTGDELITPTAPDVAGKAFVGWYDGETKFEDFNTVLTITETTTRTITAKYENALYVYFYNPEGTQIMRTEKVGDNDPHGYTDVSYDVDSTHKLVGWAAERNGTENIADKITVPKGSTSVNVYAIIKKGYWVTFDSDGGSIVDSQFVLNGDKLVLNENTNPTKPGYTFAGWYNDSTKVENGATVTNPMTLKAHWNAVEVNYTINYWQQKVTDDKNATDAEKTYEYVEAETKKATTGTPISAENLKTYKGFKYNANNSSKDVKISGDGTTIINVYYDRVLCTVNFYTYESTGWFGGSWKIIKTVTGLYGANLPEGAWDSSKNLWFTKKSDGSNAVLLTSFDFETAGYAKNQDNVSENGIVTTCNFYAGSGLNGTVKYYNEQSDGTFKLVQTVRTNGESLNVHEKYEGYELYRYSTDSKAQETAQYWEKQSSVKDSVKVYGDIINIASKLKTYSLSYYNYNGVAKTEKNIKYTASLKSYANYTPVKPSGLPDYYVFGGWYKDKACTTKFDFNTEKMPNANMQIYAKWTAKKINLTYNLNTPDGTSKKVNSDVDAGTIASTVLPSASEIKGYSFAGWYYADGNGNITKDVFNANDAITKDTSVIGKWLYNGRLTVVYNPGSEESKATVPTDSNIYAGGAKATVAKNATTTSKKKFLGWELNRNLYHPGDAFEVNKDLAKDNNVITLTAVWGSEEHSTTMSYNPGNGRGSVQTVPVKNNESVTLKSEKGLGYQAPEEEGKEYYFAGWATSKDDADNGKATYAAGQTVHVDVNGENVLYATWIEKTVITVKAKSDTTTYTGKEHKVEGFKETEFTVDGNKYTVEGLKASGAAGTDAGKYTSKVTGTAVVKDAAGNDVTAQFTVKTENGNLVINPRAVTLKSANLNKEYDGTALVNGETALAKEEGWAEGEGATYEFTGSQTVVGTSANAFSYNLKDGTKAGNYTISKTEGTLTVKDRATKYEITVKAKSDTTTYTGKEHKVEGFKETEFTVDGNKYTVEGLKASGAAGTDAGKYTSKVTGTAVVKDAAGNDVTAQFTVKTENGNLVINPRAVTLKSANLNKEYDGTALVNGETALAKEEGWAEGEGATYEFTGSQTVVGTSANAFSYNLKDGTKAGNYTISKTEGTLTVKDRATKYEITVKAKSDTTTYTGKEHKVEGFKETEFTVDGNKYTVEGLKASGAAGTDAGKYTSKVTGTAVVKDAAGNDVTAQFTVKTENGNLVINPRAVTLKSANLNKEYDGKALVNGKTALAKEEGWAEGEGATYEFTGSQTVVGTSANAFSYNLKDGTKAGNYTISKTEGTLTVKDRATKYEITVKAKSDTTTYTGKEHKVEGFKETEFTVDGNKYTVEGLKASGAAGTDAGKYTSKVTGTAVVKDAAGNDVTAQFTVKTENGNLVINPRAVTLKSANLNKEYDGTALVNGETALAKEEGWAEGEGATYEFTGSQTVVGTSANAFSYNLKDGTKAGNYTISKTEGTLTVKDRATKYEITVKAKSDTTTYTGKEHKVEGFKETEFTVDGNKYTVEGLKASGAAGTDAGKYTSKVTGTAVVKDAAGNDVTAQFTVKTENGNLVINPRAVTLKSANLNKEYDGTALVNGETALAKEEGWAEGEGATYEFTGSQTVVGTSANAFSYNLKDGTKAGNYTISKTEGTLTVKDRATKYEITVKAKSDTTTYTGKEHKVEGFKETEFTVDGNKYTVEGLKASGAAGTDAGKYTSKVTGTAVVKDAAGNDVTAQFTVKTENGNLVINPRAVTLKSANLNKEYDGKALVNGKTALAKEEGWAEGEGATYEFTGSQTVVGTSANAFSYNLKDGTKAGNYTISKTEGTLTVKDRATKYEITVKAKSDTTTYTGKEHKVEGFEATEFTVDGNKYTVEGLTASGATGTDAGNYTSKVTGKAVVKDAADNNVTKQFTVKTENGNLVINRKKYTVETLDGNKTYDGTPLTAGAKINGIIAGEVVEIKTTKSLTDVGSILNDKYELTWKTAKATNYKLDGEKFGTLTVTTQSIDPGTDPEKPNPDYTGAKVNSPKDEVYDGNEHKWIPTVTDKADKKLKAGTDYTVEYSTKNFKDVGTIDVTITGIGNYSGTVTRTYKITPKSVTVTAEDKTKVFGETDPELTAKVDGTLGNDTVDYKLSREAGEAAGKYEITVKGDKLQGNYTVTYVAGTLTITSQSIDPGTDPEKPNPDYTGAKVNSPKDEVYDGNEHKWIPTVTDKADKKLKAGKDYTVEYSTSDFTNVGTIEVTITGKGNYSGTVKRSYKVTPKEYTVTTDSATKTYSGTALTAGGKVEGIVSGETVEFTTTGSQTEVGTSKNTYELVWKSAKATNYTLAKESIGTLTVKAKSIVPDGPDTPNEKKTGITVSEPSDSKYDGKEHKEVLTVTDTKTGKELVAGTDYSVTYSSDLVNAGTVKVTVAGLGNYTGSFTKTYKITKRSVTLTSATVSKVYDGSALTNTSIAVSGDGFVKGEGASYEVTGTQTEVGNSANAFEYKLNEKTLASNYNITKVVGTLTITAAPAPVTPATPSTPSSTTSTTPRTPSAPQVTTPAETVEKETTPKAEPKKEEKVEEEYTPKASPQYYWALINLICAILTVLFGLLLLISKRHKDEDDDEEDDETKQQTNNDDEEKEQEKKRGLFTRVLAVLIAIVSVVFFLVTEDLSLPWTWTDQWTIWMVVIGLVQIVVFFVGRKWKNVDNDDEDEEAQQA